MQLFCFEGGLWPQLTSFATYQMVMVGSLLSFQVWRFMSDSSLRDSKSGASHTKQQMSSVKSPET